MKMCIVTAHAGAESLRQATESWVGSEVKWEPIDHRCEATVDRTEPPVMIVNGKDGMLPAYQTGLRLTGDRELGPFDILAYLHDDTIINDPNWTERVMKEFEDPTVGLVGFGGATGHGDPNMYRKPYEYQQLARHNFLSNMRDAENHGRRFTGECDVAVLDGFALIVRRELLEKCGGWFLNTPICYIAYDYALSCWARRLGYRIRLVGVACDHLGGQTFVKLGIGKDPKHWQAYLDAHEYCYQEFRDVLPYQVNA